MFPGSLAQTNRQQTLSINVGPGASTTGPSYGQSSFQIGPSQTTFQPFPNQYAQGFPSNTSVMLPYAIKPKLPVDERVADIGMNEVLFVRVNDTSRGTNPYPDYQIRSLSRMNKHLLSPECRKKYGASKSVDTLLRDWQLLGIAQRDPVLYGNSEIGVNASPMPENVMTVIVGGRARLWNLWTASGNAVRPGNRVWLIPVRHPFVPMVAEESSGPEYFWRLEPYVTTAAADPPMDVYWNTRYRSIPIYIGYVQAMSGKVDNQLDDYFYRSLRAVFPDSAGAKYRDTLLELNELILFVGQR